MSLEVIFGTNLRNYRKARRLTQAELAEKVALSTEMISKIERGVAAPSFVNIEKLSEVLGVSEAALFGGVIVGIVDAERSQLLSKINHKLSRMSDEQLAKMERFIAIFNE